MSRHQCEPLKTFKFNVSDEPNKIDKQAMNSNSQVQNSAKIDVQNANKKKQAKNAHFIRTLEVSSSFAGKRHHSTIFT